MRIVLSLLVGMLAAVPLSAREKRAPEKEKVVVIGGKTFESWLKDLRDKDPSVRRMAIQAILYFADENEVAVKDLLYILEHDDYALRCNAAVALMGVTLDDKNKLLPDVIKGLANQLRGVEHTQINIRYHCACTLARFGEHSQPAILVLATVAKDQYTSWEVRHACVNALISVGKKDNVVNATVTNTLLFICNSKEPAAAVKHDAFMGLATMGTPVLALQEQVTRFLGSKLKDKDKVVAVWAHYGLIAQRGDKDNLYLKALSKLLTDSSEVPTKMAALRALHALVPVLKRDAKVAVLAMIETLKDDDPAVFGTTCWTLQHISTVVGVDETAQTVLGDVINQEIIRAKTFREKMAKAKPPQSLPEDFKTPKHHTALYTIKYLKGEIDPETGLEKKKPVVAPKDAPRTP